MSQAVDLNALPSGFYAIGKIMGTQEYSANGDRRPQMGVALAMGMNSYRFYFDLEVARALGLDAQPDGTLVMVGARPYGTKNGGVGFGDCQFIGFL